MVMTPDLIVVFGAAGGMGRAVTDLARNQSFRVIGYDKVPRADGEFEVLELDACDPVEVQEGLSSALRYANGGSVAVVNAVGTPSRGTIADVTPEEFERAIDINLRSAYFITQGLVRSLQSGACSWAGIIHIASGAGALGSADRFAYSVAKAGLLGLCKQVSKDFKDGSFRIVAISPGLVDTDFATPMLTAEEREEYRRRRASSISAEGIAELALWTIRHGMIAMHGGSLDVY